MLSVVDVLIHPAMIYVSRDVIRSQQPPKIFGNSSCHRRLLFFFKKNRENLSSISNTTYSACIYWLACLRLQIFTNKHRYISSNPNNISRYFPLIRDEIVDGEGLNYTGYTYSRFFPNFFGEYCDEFRMTLYKITNVSPIQ